MSAIPIGADELEERLGQSLHDWLRQRALAGGTRVSAAAELGMNEGALRVRERRNGWRIPWMRGRPYNVPRYKDKAARRRKRLWDMAREYGNYYAMGERVMWGVQRGDAIRILSGDVFAIIAAGMHPADAIDPCLTRTRTPRYSRESHEVRSRESYVVAVKEDGWTYLYWPQVKSLHRLGRA